MTKKASTHSVKESDRSKRLSKLETPQEIQKDIQSMYNEAKKLSNKKIANETLRPEMNSILYSMKHYVDETQDVENMNVNQVSKFWNGAYSHLERLEEIANEK